MLVGSAVATLGHPMKDAASESLHTVHCALFLIFYLTNGASSEVCFCVFLMSCDAVNAFVLFAI